MRPRPRGSAQRGRPVPAAPPGLPSWVVGVDSGGTWLRVLARHPAGDARAARVPAARFSDLGQGLARLLRRWRIGPAKLGALVVAARGVWTARERRAAARGLSRLGRRVRVVSDVEAAYLGALGERSGLLLLAGTGSIALARGVSGSFRRAGGLGPLLGDEGSSFWIGRQWLRVRAGEGRRARLGGLPSPAAVSRIAALAPTVLRRARGGDRAARLVVAGAQRELAALLAEAAGRARLGPPIRVSWAGRLMADQRFRNGVWRAARRRGLRIAPVAPTEAPVAAALRLAASLAR